MIDLTRVRTRWGANPHYVNVDLDKAEIGYLVWQAQFFVGVCRSHRGVRRRTSLMSLP